jgi:DNA mismatch endonuclease (patch repair protein)
MIDKVSPEVRSRIMASIKGKDTKPEMAIRKNLHSLGFRYRLHVKELPGRPDIVLPKYNAIILVNGCFWHGHGCHFSRRKSIRSEYWLKKIPKNMERDERNKKQLRELGWRIATVWECAIFGKTKIPLRVIGYLIYNWLKSDDQEITLEGG